MGDITISGSAVVALGALMTALAATVTMLFKLLMVSKDAQYGEAIKSRDGRILELSHERDSFRSIADEAMHAAEVAANKLRIEHGQEPLPKIAAVVPEHRSPTTPSQEDAAALATLRARAVVVAMEVGLPPRTLSTVEPKGADTMEAEAAKAEAAKAEAAKAEAAKWETKK